MALYKTRPHAIEYVDALPILHEGGSHVTFIATDAHGKALSDSPTILDAVTFNDLFEPVKRKPRASRASTPTKTK